MSRRPIVLSADLQRLQNEEYDLEIRGGYLLIRAVPYVDSARTVQRGVLFMPLDLAADVTRKPTTHIAYWKGTHPCHSDGTKITTIENPSPPQDFGNGIRADFTFSAKADYTDYYHKVTTYVGRIAGEANKLDPIASIRISPVIAEDTPDGVFRYIDTASSRAGIGALSSRFAGKRIGIVGLGGTGGYVLDLVAKTSVAEIHLFDGDMFSQHNAFRAPGAATIEALKGNQKKVSYFSEIYSNMHGGIIVHDVFLDETSVSLLNDLDFVFVCIDSASAKRAIVQQLLSKSIAFIEVGMGILYDDGQLGGIVRITTSTAENRESAAQHISFAEGDRAANAYSTNIQVAELNALNATLAVIRWKKLMGMYRDTKDEYYGGYSIASGEIVSEGAACHG